MRCPSSVRLSSVHPSLPFHIFDFSTETTDQNSTKLKRKQDLNVLYQVCVFRADRKNKIAALASDWLRHFRLLLWNRWTEFNKTWQEARSQRPLLSLCFSGRSEKQDGSPWIWLAETFSTFPLKPLNRIQQNLTGSKISTSSTKFVFFGPIKKTRWPPWTLIDRDIFDFSSEQNSNETWQEARSQRPLPSLFFSGWSENYCGRPGLWLAEAFLTSPLKLSNGIQQNLTGSKIAMSSTMLVFSGQSEKRDGRPCLWLAETFTTSPLNGIQRNLTGSKISTSSTKFVFSGRWVNKICRPGKKVAHCTQVHDIRPFGPLVINWQCCLAKRWTQCKSDRSIIQAKSLHEFLRNTSPAVAVMPVKHKYQTGARQNLVG